MPNPLLKYCGIRTLEDLKLTSISKATHLGFIFAKSKRHVTPSEVGKWLKEVDISSKKLVAVFVNPTVAEIEEVLDHVNLDVIQLHGDETTQYVKYIREKVHLTIWKALHHTKNTIQQMEEFQEVVDGFVIDSRVKGQRGGTGISFNWNLVPTYLETARKHQKQCFIAGGINEDNVQQLLSFNPIGIDLSSGIEEHYGKSATKIQKLEERMLKYVHIS